MSNYPPGFFPPGFFTPAFFGPVNPAGGAFTLATLDLEIGVPVVDLHAAQNGLPGASVLSDLSTAAVFVAVAAFTRAGDAAGDPTANTVAMAFNSGRDPQAADFNAASWFARTVGGVTTYFAWVIVGPAGAVALSPGTVTVWLKVSGGSEGSETPVYNAGTLTVR